MLTHLDTLPTKCSIGEWMNGWRLINGYLQNSLQNGLRMAQQNLKYGNQVNLRVFCKKLNSPQSRNTTKKNTKNKNWIQ